MTATKTPAFHKPPLFTRQQLIALLLPLIAEQALSVTIGLADTLMVSSVGEAAVSGVSLVDSFNTLMIQIMSALATGGAVVTSQYIGRQEPKDAKNAAAQILFILSSFSLLVAARISMIWQSAMCLSVSIRSTTRRITNWVSTSTIISLQKPSTKCVRAVL